MRCPMCEQPIADNAPFCPYCGKVFDAAVAETARDELTKQAAKEAAQAPGAVSPAMKMRTETLRRRDAEARLVVVLILGGAVFCVAAFLWMMFHLKGVC